MHSLWSFSIYLPYMYIFSNFKKKNRNSFPPSFSKLFSWRQIFCMPLYTYLILYNTVHVWSVIFQTVFPSHGVLYELSICTCRVFKAYDYISDSHDLFFNYFISVGGRTFCTESTNVWKSSVLQINFFEKFWMLIILSYHRFYIWRSEKMIKHSKDHSVWCIFNALVLLELKKIKIHYSLFWEITFLLLMQHIKPTF